MMMMMMIVKQKTFTHYVSLKMVLLTLPNLHLFLRQRGYKTSTTHLYSDYQIVWAWLFEPFSIDQLH